IDRFVDEADLDITADDGFTVWVNGTEVGRGTGWHTVRRFDVKKLLVTGENVIAVAATGDAPGAARPLGKPGYVPHGTSKVSLVSDGTWKASREAPDGWQRLDFDDRKWAAARALCPYGQGPWKKVTWEAGGDDRFSVPAGFRVEAVVPPSARSPDPKL